MKIFNDIIKELNNRNYDYKIVPEVNFVDNNTSYSCVGFLSKNIFDLLYEQDFSNKVKENYDYKINNVCDELINANMKYILCAEITNFSEPMTFKPCSSIIIKGVFEK